MNALKEKLRKRLVAALWSQDLDALDRPRRVLVTAARIAYVVVRDLYQGQLTLRAMGLVYTTLLSIVPLLALSFSVLKGFGVHNQLEPVLANFLAPLGPRGAEITTNIIAFVDNVKVGVLGSIGVLLLLYTAISLIQKIEGSFNFIWGTIRRKNFARVFSDYLSVILIGPLFVFTAIGLTATVMSTGLVQAIVAIEPFGALVYFTGRLLPYVLVCAAFTLIYLFVPNVKVRLASALIGGMVAGILWEALGWVFASFVVTSARYEAIYSGFAILIMFMIWLYVSWLILLVGAQIAFYHQHLHMLTPDRRFLQPSARQQEVTALNVMYLATERFLGRRPAWVSSALAERLALHPRYVETVLMTLVGAGLLVETNDEPPAYVPARDPEAITLAEVLRAVRHTPPGATRETTLPATVREVEKVLERFEKSMGMVLGSETLRDLVAGREEAEPNR